MNNKHTTYDKNAHVETYENNEVCYKLELRLPIFG